MASIEGLSADGKILLSYIQAEFAKFTESLSKYEALSVKCEEIDSLKTKVDLLEKTVYKMKDDLDWADQYERKDIVVISGSAVPPVTTDRISGKENTHDLVCTLVKNNLNVDLLATDINTCHRLGPVNRAECNSNRRNIVVKLCRRDKKKEIIEASKRLKKPNFFCNESLTATRRTIYQALRKMRKDQPTLVKGCNTIEGKIYGYTPPEGTNARDKRHLINNMEELKTFCRTYVKLPIDNFLLNFSS